MNWSRQRNEHVRSDCEELLARFQQTDSVRFENFSRIWREMKFGQIFYGTAGREKRAFSRLVLDVAFVYFLPPFSFQIRVGGLYLIYGLYRCQTASPRVGSSRRARLLSSIKSKAYGQAAEACKSRRHRQVEVDAGDSSGPAPPKGRSTSRRVSLKARTHENVRIAGEMWKEATTPTSINRLTAVDRGPEGIVIGGIGVTFSDAFSLSFQPKKKEDREDSVEQCFVSSSVDEGKGARRLRGRERSFMVQLWKTTAAAFLGLFSLPASFYDWKVFYVAQQYMTRLEFKILKIGRHSSEILCIII
ncbi:snRNA-activating protein complex subunit 1b isoform X5 [Phyllopteryx taeniolatus]|uniref:snRNA-activating protein complex subunit 1b isoform X5 n=1 Tax=Phyllopteryx taeniolatus TaxID=161469 RepID=UPI002AD57FA3|nr:snRNA-activating protein complex subunit 1b isoform X5 [Phyllopteryx taeniolatus]